MATISPFRSLSVCPRCGPDTFLSLPDVDAAEHSEEHPEDKGHGHGQQRGQQPVKDELDQLKGGVASYPHPVEAVRARGLRDHVFKTNLSGHPSHAETKKDIISADTHDGGGGARRLRLPGIQAQSVTPGEIKRSR